MKKFLAIAICSMPLAVIPAVYAQSGTGGATGGGTSSGSSTQAPSTAPTPSTGMGGTSPSSGKHGTAGATMGEGMKSHNQSKSSGTGTDSTEAAKRIGGEPVESATPKKSTPPGTSANQGKTSQDGKVGK